MAKLKVFRTAIGFHDAYVAAPSRKAALAAWGADKDLFARGMAEEVTDPDLIEAPLAAPGEVVKVSRGGRDAHLAALPAAAKTTRKTRAKSEPEPRAKVEPTPKPSRDAVAAAEEALADAERRHDQARAEIAAVEAALERRKRDLKRAQETEIATLNQARDAAEADYRAALAAWRASA